MVREKNRLERAIDTRRQIKVSGKERIGELGIRYGRTKDVLHEAKKGRRTADQELRLAKRGYRRELRVNKELLESKQALAEAKMELELAQIEAVQSPLVRKKTHHQSSRQSTSQVKASSSPQVFDRTSLEQDQHHDLLQELSEAVVEIGSGLGDGKSELVTQTGETSRVDVAYTAYQKARRAYQSTKKRVKKEAQEKVDEAKFQQKVAKTVELESVRQSGGSHRRRLLRYARQATHQQASRQVNDILQEDDTLADVAVARQHFTRAQVIVPKTKQVARVTASGSKYVLTRSYNLGNRVYNLSRGRGFTVTPKEFSWHGRLGARYRMWKQKVNQNQSVKALRGAKRMAGWAWKPIGTVLKNPLSLKGYVAMFIIALVLAFFSLGNSIAIQDEYDLNQSWLYLTKKDREQSTDKVDYWTNWEDPLLYINHRYDEIADTYNLSDERLMVDQLLGEAYLNTLWEDLNKDEENLKTMADLYTDNTSYYYLEQEDLEDYQELLETAQEIGKFSALQELDNPFYQPDSDQYEAPLKITKRFGYTSKDNISNETTLYATSGQEVYAVMTGTIEVDGDDVIITDKEARFTYKDLTGLQVRSGDKVEEGTLLGRTSSGNQVISYQKLLASPDGEKDAKGNIKPEWGYVNPGFYFQHVTYTQATSVIRSVSMDGDKIKRIQRFAELIKQLIPDATDEGIASVLGAFDAESGVTFKRYEADYLTDYQFDKVAQEPTAENLMGNWSDFAALYNSPLNEPGYLVNGRHYIGVGVGMWTGGRTLALWEFARANGLDIWSEEAQVRFLLEGDNPYYTQIFREAVTSTASTDETTRFFLDNWLGVPGNKLLERQNSAKQILNLLKRPGLNGDYSHIFNVPYKVIQPYGPTPWALGGGAWMYPKGRHDGVDLVPVSGDFANTDVPVFSATNGRVHAKYGSDLGGYAIVIEVDFGGYLYYGHLKRLPEIAVGAEVKMGDPIAVLGNTGAYGIYHVHLQYNETSPNPLTPDDRDPSFLILKDGSVTQDQIITP